MQQFICSTPSPVTICKGPVSESSEYTVGAAGCSPLWLPSFRQLDLSTTSFIISCSGRKHNYKQWTYTWQDIRGSLKCVILYQVNRKSHRPKLPHTVAVCRYFCTCFLQHLHTVLCCCSGIDLHFSHHGVYTCVLLFVQMNVVPSGVWKLLPRMNQTCGGLQFLRSWLISLDFSHDVKQRGTEFEGSPWNTSTGIPTIGLLTSFESIRSF